ncbi:MULTISPECIES: hypothetical protein [unclassified Mucilaginibacter]|uniref:hypothetical protein n=1 Tax=unclassified Mucilaginibacter TaxID=2617802 RepID=UPI002AC9A517|nr:MULTISPECIES: hypothetical protein [unclassified Mucilaginibacter]MEB0263140.1 hypothetical protein [Mucilaginibacter sp. 10I4]MEB0280266.1 hypothetical protein [Mucilaginibacter sp. 10B2]MEB0300211.1 hypothetical protein [Mucilaginibacter sp. 5C4]WPX25569.1 hypothetical protein RHM67_09850 [Mucilaginibacter sp. 5C4]
MKIIKFKYDKFGIIHSLAFIIIAIVVISIASFGSNANPHLLPIVAIITFITIFIYIAINYLKPLLRGEPAMVIDDEKIFIRRNSTVIFWREVSKVDRLVINKSYYVIIHLKNETQVRISLIFYEVEADLIYKTLKSFFKNINFSESDVNQNSVYLN